ncbi:hypothetical protein K491DRAFT_3017 [Lophiostoma macrostomum CBS 122681]|uniref:Uncharacterized protein n=1 Tax=Lophiostoma macrostomum CBS 122681 TaxID=1314788 RepID=A0A6A6TSN5_9PLEO|nr:hypothetical protein K491DRAFT_3017 [Lophiostoma macrostomum CBS 122681]
MVAGKERPIAARAHNFLPCFTAALTAVTTTSPLLLRPCVCPLLLIYSRTPVNLVTKLLPVEFRIEQESERPSKHRIQATERRNGP